MRQLRGLVLLTGFCLAPLIGCGCTTATSAPVVEAEGAIAYDGQPVADGIIAFIPVDADERTGSGGAVQNGKYRVYPEANLKPGTYRVEIRWGKPTGEKKEAGYGQSPDVIAEALPDKYHARSILTAELKAGMNTVDFNLEK